MKLLNLKYLSIHEMETYSSWYALLKSREESVIVIQYNIYENEKPNELLCVHRRRLTLIVVHQSTEAC